MLSFTAREGSHLTTYEDRIIGIVVIGLNFVSKHAVTMQSAIAIEPVPKIRPLSKIAKSEMFHLLQAPSACSVPHTVVKGTSRRHAIIRVL